MRDLIALPTVRAVNEAEARGDVRGAIDLIEHDLGRRHDGMGFWSPDRLTHLLQLWAYDGMLPGWATSRWILHQAVRWLDGPQHRRCMTALEETTRVVGVPEDGGPFDACQVMDHDWVYRQLVLYEFAGLQHFLDHVASVDLLEEADHVQGWARAPMGAFRLEGSAGGRVTWRALGDFRSVETQDVGAATALATGDHVIGRLVPIHGGVMFETAPLPVPPDVAVEVARAPGSWLSALEGARHQVASATGRISTRVLSFPLLHDTPDVEWAWVAADVVGEAAEEALAWTEDEAVERHVGVVAAALSGELRVGGAVTPELVVASVLLQPEVFLDLLTRSDVGTDAEFARLADRLAAPADSVCRFLAAVRACSSVAGEAG